MTNDIRMTGQSKRFYACTVFIIPVFIALMLLITFNQAGTATELLGIIGICVTVLGIAACMCSAIILNSYDRLSEDKIIALILLAGFFVKLGYVIRCPYNVHQHDVESLTSSGHLSYIYRLANGDGLPLTNSWQYCHPPLHHYLSSVIVRISRALGHADATAFENIQLLTLIYSHLTTVIWCTLLRKAKVSGNALYIVCALFAFHPTFTILSASINNDILTVLLMSAAVYFLFCWYSEPSIKYAAVIGAFVGLAMMSKFSAVLIAVTVAIVVLIKFISDKEYKCRSFFAQSGIFLAVSVPLGLWYQVRNMIKFGQPLGYVAPIPTTSGLYTGNESLISRFLIAPAIENKKLFCAPFDDVNIIAYTLRCSVFGEYKWNGTAICAILLAINAVMIVISIVCAIVLLTRHKGLRESTSMIFAVMWIVHLVFFVYFYLTSPFGCTMDYRYIVLTLLANAGLLAMYLNKLQSADKRSSRAMFGIISALTVTFCIFSTLALY